ncbi:MAG: hypothetical protein ABSA58_06515 [Acetobacteraceae bacterium]
MRYEVGAIRHASPWLDAIQLAVLVQKRTVGRSARDWRLIT